jgi:hypothetical protein
MELNTKRLSSLDFLCKILSPVISRKAVLGKIQNKQLNWLTIIEIANENFLTSALFFMLKDKDLLRYIDDVELIAYLNEIYNINLKRNLEIIDQSKELAMTLEKRGVKPLFLKGAASLLLKNYKDPGIRFLTDIDFYVDNDFIKEVLKGLKSIGYARDPKCTYDYDALHHHYTPMFSPKWQTFIEPHIAILHHNRTTLFPQESSFIESPYDKDIYTFSPENRFLHAYLHTDFDHKKYWKRELDLRQLYEISILIFNYQNDIDWNFIQLFIEKRRIKNPFNDQMYFIQKLFGISIPIVKPSIRSKLYTLSIQSKFKYKTDPKMAIKEEKFYKNSKTIYKRYKEIFFKFK